MLFDSFLARLFFYPLKKLVWQHWFPDHLTYQKVSRAHWIPLFLKQIYCIQHRFGNNHSLVIAIMLPAHFVFCLFVSTSWFVSEAKSCLLRGLFFSRRNYICRVTPCMAKFISYLVIKTTQNRLMNPMSCFDIVVQWLFFR